MKETNSVDRRQGTARREPLVPRAFLVRVQKYIHRMHGLYAGAMFDLHLASGALGYHGLRRVVANAFEQLAAHLHRGRVLLLFEAESPGHSAATRV